MSELSSAKIKYNKIFIDNLTVPGYIGEYSQYKTLREYLSVNISQVSSLVTYKDKMDLDLKQYKDKLEKQNKVISSNEKMIKDQEGLIDSLKKLNASQDKAIKEKYARYDKLDELERQIKNATRRKDDIDRAIESGTELSGLIVEIENFLKTKLCPINYSRAIFEQKNSPVVIENVTEIVSVVEQWCYDMKKMIKTTINSDEYDGEIIDVEINK